MYQKKHYNKIFSQFSSVFARKTACWKFEHRCTRESKTMALEKTLNWSLWSTTIYIQGIYTWLWESVLMNFCVCTVFIQHKVDLSEFISSTVRNSRKNLLIALKPYGFNFTRPVALFSIAMDWFFILIHLYI